MGGLAFKESWLQAVEGLMVEISLIRVWVIFWNLSDGSVETREAIKMSEGGGFKSI